jgi:hypothetical protein
MKWNPRHRSLIALSAAMVIAAVIFRPANAQLAPPTGATYEGSVPSSKKVVSGIAWYGVLQDGLDEAKRTHCDSVQESKMEYMGLHPILSYHLKYRI